MQAGILFRAASKAAFSIWLAIVCVGCDLEKQTDPHAQIILEHDDQGRLIGSFEAVDSIYNGLGKIYDSLGFLAAEIEFVDGLRNGKSRQYQSGTLAVEAFFLNGLPHGIYKGYYPSGNVERQGKFFQGVQVGLWLFYFDKPKDAVRKRIEYVLIQDSSVANYIEQYDRGGKVTFNSTKLTFTQTKDGLQIELIDKELHQVQVIIGNFDQTFNIIEASKLDTIPISANEIVLPMSQNDTIRGVVELYQWIDSKRIVKRPIFFCYPRSTTSSGLSFF